MPSFREGATAAVRRAYCKALQGVDNYFAFWGSLGIPVDQVPPSWKNWICGEPGPPPPAPPFTGGQCPCVEYEISFQVFDNGVLIASPSETRDGPISVEVVNKDTEFGGIEVYINYGDGVNCTSGRSRPTNLTNTAINTYTASNFVVVRSDGQPDNCGDPITPVPPFPPGGFEEPEDIDWDGPDGPESEPVTITINAPIIVPFIPFTLYAPVTISGPNIEFSGNIEIAPEFNFRPNFGGGDSSPGDPQGDGPPENPITAPPTADDEDDQELIGVLVRSQPVSETRTTELDGQLAPDLFVPRLAVVHFRTRNRGRFGWNGPHDVLTTSSYVPVPPNVYAIDARVTYQQGWGGGFFRIFGQRAT